MNNKINKAILLIKQANKSKGQTMKQSADGLKMKQRERGMNGKETKEQNKEQNEQVRKAMDQKQ